jgi:hypothetical protein
MAGAKNAQSDQVRSCNPTTFASSVLFVTQREQLSFRIETFDETTVFQILYKT